MAGNLQKSAPSAKLRRLDLPDEAHVRAMIEHASSDLVAWVADEIVGAIFRMRDHGDPWFLERALADVHATLSGAPR